MRICLFGSASDSIDKKYMDAVEDLSEKMAENNIDLVFGAGGCGLMGAAARGFKKGGANIIGVVPEFFKDYDIEALYTECDKLIYTESMRERKRTMEEYADAFIITPGGIGTFDEMFEILTLKQLERHNKPVIIYNVDGYYDALETLIDHAIEEHFVNSHFDSKFESFKTQDEILNYLSNL